MFGINLDHPPAEQTSHTTTLAIFKEQDYSNDAFQYQYMYIHTTSKCINYITKYENDKLAMVLKIEDILDILYGCNFERRHSAVIIHINVSKLIDIKKNPFFFIIKHLLYKSMKSRDPWCHMVAHNRDVSKWGVFQ